MKRFACGDVVPGCTAGFTASTEADLLSLVAAHARESHGIDDIPPELLAHVRVKIQTVG